MDYRCSRCGRPTQPQLCEAGVSASCCEESPLLVVNKEWVPSAEPWIFLTDDERDDLEAELWKQLERDETPAMAARRRVGDGS